jgi:phosphoglycerate kinase
MLKSLDDLDLQGRRVLCRVDFNVPLTSSGDVADDTRIEAALPTLRACMDSGARLVVMSHLGRPGGTPDPALSLEGVGMILAEKLGRSVRLTDEPVGDGAKKVVQDLRDGQVALLENLRFDPGEKAGAEVFARQLASYGEVYVNDAFGAAHRGDASVAVVPRFIRERGAGRLMLAEIQALSRLLDNVPHPYVALVGGVKVADKLALLRSLVDRVDCLLIGGAMAYTFLAADGVPVGDSLVDRSLFTAARQVLAAARSRGVPVILPEDHVAGTSIGADADYEIVDVDGIREGWMGVDIGPQTVERFRRKLDHAGSIFWNGPLGVYEHEVFRAGTVAVAEIVAKSPAYSVIGGGDSAAAARVAGVTEQIGHISTGGGASLQFVQGGALSAIEALQIGSQ